MLETDGILVSMGAGDELHDASEMVANLLGVGFGCHLVSFGKLVDGVLSSGPLRAASGIGGPIGLALTPPCSVEDLAGAVVTGALGGNRGIIDGTDAIKASLAQ